MRACATLMGASEVTSQIWVVKVRACATLMGASEVTSQIWGSGGEGLCDFYGGF